MVVAALTLHGLDQDARDAVRVLFEGRFDFLAGASLFCLDVITDVAVRPEFNGGVVHPGPVKLGEQGDLVGHRVGQAHGVARAPVEGRVEVQNDQVVAVIDLIDAYLLGFPIKCHLKGVLHSEGATIDPEVVREALGGHAGGKGLDEVRHLRGVEIRVGRLVQGRELELRTEFLVLHPGVVVADGPGSKACEEVQEFLACAGIVDPGPVGPLKVHDEGQAIRQLVAAKGLVNTVGGNHL